MRRICFTIAIVAIIIELAGVLGGRLSAHAYTPTRGENGNVLTWQDAPVLLMAGNSKNNSGLSESDFSAAVIRSLRRWERASGNSVSFHYWQGADPEIYEPNSEHNGLSSVYFASQNRSQSPGPGVIGFTQVWYDSESGAILETDVQLNDIDFVFTDNPTDSTGYGSGAGASKRVYIENILSHEFGHAYGLAHAGGMQSTMLFVEGVDQAHLGCDEHAGIRAVYPGGGGAGASGTINGQVLTTGGKPVYGAHVSAISQRRGVIAASALSMDNGQFEIRALEPGQYYLLVEPFYGGSSVLPSSYRGVNGAVCNGAFFGKSFVGASGSGGHHLQAFSVTSGKSTTTGNVHVACNGSGADVSGPSGSTSLSGAPTLHQGSSGGFGYVDQVPLNGQSYYYKLQSVSGKVEVRILSHSLYSPVEAQVDFTDAFGNSLAVTKSAPSYASESGFKNKDVVLVAENLAPGDYYLRIQTQGVPLTWFPGGQYALDSKPFLLIAGTINGGGVTDLSLPFNAKCRMNEEFPPYISPTAFPLRRDTGGGGLFGFCGTIDSGSGPKGPMGPAQLAGIIGWFLPWVFMALSARLIRVWMRLHSPAQTVTL